MEGLENREAKRKNNNVQKDLRQGKELIWVSREFLSGEIWTFDISKNEWFIYIFNLSKKKNTINFSVCTGHLNSQEQPGDRGGVGIDS